MKISELIGEIDRKIADPDTPTRRFSNTTFYHVRPYIPGEEEKEAYRCAGIIRTIIGYNVRVRTIDGQLWVLVAPGMQKNPLKIAVAA
jgi:hypothetical protein